MKKRILIILLAALVVAGGGYAVSRQQLIKRAAGAEAAHDAVLNEYRTLVKNAENSTVTITEGAQTIGSFTLSELGVLDATVQDITASYSEEDRMDSASFGAMAPKEKLAWARNEHPERKAYPVNMQGYSDAPLRELLTGLPRTAAVDAFPVLPGKATRSWMPSPAMS